MKVYVAAPYPAREYVQEVWVPSLDVAGHFCTSTWANGSREINSSTVAHSPATEHADLVRHVTGDLYDIARADALISLTADFCITEARLPIRDPMWWHSGGRHVELGYALGIQQMRKSFRIITVGQTPENVFQRGLTTVVPDLVSAIGALRGQPVQRPTEVSA